MCDLSSPAAVGLSRNCGHFFRCMSMWASVDGKGKVITFPAAGATVTSMDGSEQLPVTQALVDKVVIARLPRPLLDGGVAGRS